MSEENENFEGGDGSVMVDLTNVEEAVFELIPKGKYAGTITECNFDYSQSSGKPMWAMKLTITEGEYEGRTLLSWMSFSEKALPLTKKTLAAIAPEFLTGPFNPEDKASDMEGKNVIIVTKVSKYEGENRTSVKQLEAAGDADAFMGG